MAAKILIIEDEKAVREMLCFTLKNDGFEILEAEDSNSALDALKENEINLILLDWMLPGKQGIEISSIIRSSSEIKDIPIIMLTAKSDDKEKGEIPARSALFTAMSATVGTGNIAGVATAIALGGPGAIFWMWVMGFVGMATKYGEAVLAVKFRETDSNGSYVGGPIYYLD